MRCRVHGDCDGIKGEPFNMLSISMAYRKGLKMQNQEIVRFNNREAYYLGREWGLQGMDVAYVRELEPEITQNEAFWEGFRAGESEINGLDF